MLSLNLAWDLCVVLSLVFITNEPQYYACELLYVDHVLYVNNCKCGNSVNLRFMYEKYNLPDCSIAPQLNILLHAPHTRKFFTKIFVHKLFRVE
jgi:hypothetical protein